MTSHHTDVDRVIVDRLVNGEKVEGASRAEFVAAVVKLTNRGVTAREIAHRWHCTIRSITRYRADARSGRFGAIGGLMFVAALHWPHGDAGRLALLGLALLLVIIILFVVFGSLK